MENRIDLNLSAREQRKRSMFRVRHTRKSLFMSAIGCGSVIVLVGMVALQILLSNIEVKSWPAVAMIVLAIIIFAISLILAMRKDERRMREKERSHHFGERVEFVEITSEFTAVGVCDDYINTQHHWRRNEIAEVVGRSLCVTTHDLVPMTIPLDHLTPQWIEQIKYWLNRYDDDYEDVCPDCKYDLQGSPGPACPECGRAVRYDDAAAAEQPDLHIDYSRPESNP